MKPTSWKTKNQGKVKMSDIVKIENLESVILEVRGLRVLIDSDVAQIYGVETRDINKAVTNNPDKFPAGYIVELTKTEKSELVKNLHRFEKLKHSTVNPKAFTEKGLYMLATILKSAVATRATISIIETFTKIRELSRNIKELSNIQDKTNQRTLMQRSGELRGPLKIQVSKPGKARAKNCDAAYA